LEAKPSQHLNGHSPHVASGEWVGQHWPTECVTDLDEQSNFLKLLLTPFQSNVIFRDSCGITENLRKPKTLPL